MHRTGNGSSWEELSGTPYFSENPGDSFTAWDYQLTTDYMPQPFITFRLEFNRRVASVRYYSGPGGVTPPGGNRGAPGSQVADWTPDLAKGESRFTLAMLIKL
jgi:hypothetical protein